MVNVSPTNPFPVNATVTATANTVAVATAAAPTYIEGSTDSLSMDLSGGLRITGTINATTAATAAATAPTYSAGAQPLAQTLAGQLRTLSSIDQTSPGTTNAVDANNFPVTVDTNSGNKSASTIRVVLATDQPTMTNAQPVTISAGAAVIGHVITDTGSVSSVSQAGTWNITNVSGTVSLPTGASTAALQTTGNTTLSTINTTLGSPFQAGGSIGNTSFISTQATAANLNATVVGTGTFLTQAAQSGTWNITNVSGTVSLPTGASTAAKQPALGTAGSASSDVLTVQGVASMTPLVANPTNETPVLKNGLTNTASSVISSQAATLKSYYCYNPNATVAYVQIFDVATAGAVTVGTTTPKWSIGIPATSAANLRINLSFASGIQVAATTTATGSTAPGTALDCNFSYR